MAAKGSVEDVENVQVDALVCWLKLKHGEGELVSVIESQETSASFL